MLRNFGRIGLTGFALIALVMLSGCGDSHEAAADDTVDLMEELADILESIKDEDSAKAASAELEDWAEDMQKISDRVKELEDLSADDEKALKEKYKEKMDEVGARIQKEMQRLMMDRELGKHFGDAMGKAMKAMPSD